MLLNDVAIRGLISDEIIKGADEEGVGPVCYDLTTKCFYLDEGVEAASAVLNPGDSVFVGSKEIIDLPSDIACRVILKNSRIREGLSLDAPLYFPGHKTRVFFRVTNVSANRISLGVEKGIAAISFERLEGPASSTYTGAFSDEFDFSGMASYSNVYAREIEKIENVEADLKSVEKRLYANVITILSILIGAFALINVNFGSVSEGISVPWLVVVDLCTVGGVAAMFGLLSVILHRRSSGDGNLFPVLIPFFVSVIAFLSSIIVSVVL